MIGQGAGQETGCLEVVCRHGAGGVVGGVGAQVLEGFLALSDELFERREEQLSGRRTAVADDAIRRDRQTFYLHAGAVLQAGAAAVGRVRALGASGCPSSTGVEAAAAARTAIHRFQEEAVGRAAARRAAGGELLLVQEVLDLLSRRLLQLRDGQEG